jgi:hypothetical protein
MNNGSSTFTLTDACKAMYSQLLTARASVTNVTVTLERCLVVPMPASRLQGVPPIPMCSNSEKYSHEAEILVVRQYIDA